MGYTIKVNHPHFPEGMVFNVGGLDRVPNGGSLEVDDEMERLYIMTNGQTIEDGFKNDAIVELSGSSALDQSELDALIEAYGPQPEPVPTVEEEPADQPAWLAHAMNNEGDDGA